MSHSDDELRYSLSIGSLGIDDLAVTRFQGQESVSALSHFDIEARDSDQSRYLALADLVGQSATFSFQPPHGHERWFHGIVSAADSLGRREGHSRYRLELVPLLWRLGTGRRSRVFLARSALDIVTAVLERAKVPMRNDVPGSGSPRELCVQFGESDLAFVWRLLEDEGVHAYFDHDESTAKLVLSNKIGGAPDSGAVLPYRPPSASLAIEEHAARVSRSHALRPGSIALRDFDPLKPRLNLEATQEGADPGTDIEVYEYPGGHQTPADGGTRAQRLLDELGGDGRLCRLQTDSARIRPGFAFELGEHPEDAFNGKLIALAVLHSGDEKAYVNQVVALPDSVRWRPPRLTPRPHVPGIQTATVIGPAGEEIETDPHGRVKVRFHWERASDHGDAGTCWIRTSHAWAGTAMGTLFIPRLGQEVIVRFLEGNPDRPIVVGSVYNGVNLPPADLPTEKTQSTLRSNSSPGGGGFNELRFEDASGSEQIFLHAQKDESIVVENDKTQEVRANETLLVEKNRSRTVSQNQTLEVHGHDATRVEKNQSLSVQQDRTSATSLDHVEEVTGSQTITVSATHALIVATDSRETVGGAKSIAVGAAMALTVGNGLSYGVGGTIARKVLGAHKAVVGASVASGVGGNVTSNINGKQVLDIDGTFEVLTTKDHKTEIGGQDAQHAEHFLSLGAKTIQLKADKLTFSVDGKLLLDMAKSGAIKINAATLTVDGPLTTKGSTIDMTSGSSPPSDSVSPPEPEALEAAKVRRKQLVSVQMRAADGAPVAGLRFEARMPDGSIKRGRLTGDGTAALPAPDSGSVDFSFPDLDPAEWDAE